MAKLGSEEGNWPCGIRKQDTNVALSHKDTGWVIELIIDGNGDSMVSDRISTGFMIASIPDDCKTLRNILERLDSFLERLDSLEARSANRVMKSPRHTNPDQPQRIIEYFKGI